MNQLGLQPEDATCLPDPIGLSAHDGGKFLENCDSDASVASSSCQRARIFSDWGVKKKGCLAAIEHPVSFPLLVCRSIYLGYRATCQKPSATSAARIVNGLEAVRIRSGRFQGDHIGPIGKRP